MTEQAEPVKQDRCRRCGQIDAHQHIDGDCVLRHSRSKPHVRAAHGNLCQGCLDRHGDWLTEIVELYATVSTVIDAGSITEELGEHMRTKKAPASPAPFRLAAWAIATGQINQHVRITHDDGTEEWIDAYLGNHIPDTAVVLTRWAQAVADDLGWNRTVQTTVSGAAAILKTNTQTVATMTAENVITYDTELRWVRRILRNVHGISDPKPLGSCLTVTNGQSCGGRVMPDPSGGQPECTRCHRRYSDLDLVRLQITEERTA